MNIEEYKYMDAVTLFRACGPLFTALSNEGRQDIISFLTQHKGSGVNEITKHIGLSQPTVSHHLKVLKAVGLVRVQTAGTKRLYFLSFEGHALLLRQLLDAVESYHNITARKK